LWLLAGSVPIALGIWPDVGALMFALFLVPAALYLHAYWKLDDPAARRTQQSSFLRNLMMLGSSLLAFGTFATLGGALRFTLTAPVVSVLTFPPGKRSRRAALRTGTRPCASCAAPPAAASAFARAAY